MNVWTGARGFDSDGTTMVKRSSHIPMFTEIDAMRVPAIVRVRGFARIVNGTTKQNASIAQNNGANRPNSFALNTLSSFGSCAYHVVRCSANVKYSHKQAITSSSSPRLLKCTGCRYRSSEYTFRTITIAMMIAAMPEKIAPTTK